MKVFAIFILVCFFTGYFWNIKSRWRYVLILSMGVMMALVYFFTRQA